MESETTSTASSGSGTGTGTGRHSSSSFEYDEHGPYGAVESHDTYDTAESMGEVWYRPPIPKKTPSKGLKLRTQGLKKPEGSEAPDAVLSPNPTHQVLSPISPGPSQSRNNGDNDTLRSKPKKKKSFRYIVDEFRGLIGSSGADSDSTAGSGKSRIANGYRLLKRRVASDSELDFASTSILKWVRGELIGGDPSAIRVHLALNVNTGEMMVVKQVEIPQLKRTTERYTFLKQREYVRRLQRESELLALLEHPNIVQYLGYEETDTIYNLFLGYVSGGSVGSLLQQHGRLKEENVVFLLKQVLSGLRHLHLRGIAHRDLTVNNILVEHSGVCKISGFGAYERIDPESSATDYNYRMAPEVAVVRRNGNLLKADIWGIGCLLVETLTGYGPWTGPEGMEALTLFSKGVSPTNVTLSDLAEDFRQECFAIDPDHRPTAEDLLAHTFLELPSNWQLGVADDH